MQLNNICALVCRSALLHRTAADLMKIECRLVEGVTVKDHFSKLCLPGTADAVTIQQHEQQVLEVAVQLIHVRHAVNKLSSTSSSLAFH